MMMLKDLIRSGKRQEPFRAVIYGTDGVGKSTWAAESDKPLFLDIEDGISQLNTDSIPLNQATYDDVIETIRMLINEEHEYETIVIDSIDWLEEKIWNKVVREYEKPIKNIEDIGYAKGYTFALEHWRKLIAGLECLRKGKKMNIILIAHGSIVRIEDPQYESYDKWSLKLHKKARAVIQEWADVIMFADFEKITRKVSDSFGQGKYKALGDGSRVIHTQEKPAFDAKSRFAIPDTLPMEFAVFKQSLIDARG